MSALKVLIVGFGRRGRQWEEAVRRARLGPTGVVDSAPDAREAAAGAGAASWADLDEGLAAFGPELVIVATPAEHHAGHAEACLTGGHPVLVEKPLAPSLEEARRVADAAAAAGVPALVAQNFRFRRVELAVRDALGRGTLGALRAGVMVSAHPDSCSDSRLEHAPLWEFAIHHLDLWRDRLGADPELVEAELVGPGPEYLLRLVFPGGPGVTYRHREGAPAFHWYEWIEGDHAALRVELESVRLHSPRHRPRRARWPRAPAPERALLERALAAVRSGEAASLSAEANLGTIAMVEAACASLAQERKPRV